MQEAQNTQVVKNAYAAFLSQDITTLLSLIDEQVVWRPVVGANVSVPNAGERHGRASVAEFFKITGESYQFTRFEPREYIAQGDRVVALGHYTAKTSVGGSVDADFVMIFTVRNGKVTAFQEFSDSAALNAAWAGAAVRG
jgi:ketosteroid isomerase-like protein